jgi:hypothetical protein
MQHFATHLRPAQQTTHSLRAGQYKNAIKRKRDTASEEPPDGPGDDAKGPSPASNTQSSPSDLPEQLPPPPFPHGSAAKSKDHLTYAKVQQEIAGLNPAIYVADATTKSHAVGGAGAKPALRKTHLDVLSTVMHRCLLEGDYDRAARAWGMILRTRVAGQPIDSRYHARWGIGAELLLRREDRNDFDYIQNESSQELAAESEHSRADEDGLFTQYGFDLAQDYYERFIVQYPNRKMIPHAVDSRFFYPPLFSIWIRSVLEKSKHARRELEIERQRARSTSVTSEGDTTITSEDARARSEAIQDEELALAREICERLDQLVVSPPFDKHAQLLLLRANVGLWISDLMVGARNRSQQDDDDDWDMEASENAHSTAESMAEELRKQADSLAELRRAQEFFTRAETNGSGCAGPAISRVEVKIRDLTRQMAKLGG